MTTSNFYVEFKENNENDMAAQVFLALKSNSLDRFEQVERSKIAGGDGINQFLLKIRAF